MMSLHFRFPRNQRYRRLVQSVFVAALLLFFSAPREALAQSDEAVELFVLPRSIELAYRTDGDSNAPVFFVGEPIELQLQLRNRTGKPIQFLDAPEGWFRLFEVTFISADGKTVRYTPLPSDIERPRQPNRPKGTLVAPAWFDEAVMRFDKLPQDMPPGRYVVAVSLSRNILPDGVPIWMGGKALEAQRQIEWREPVSREDLLNHSLNMAVRARWQNRFEEARTWLEKTVQLNPASVTAQIQSAALWEAQGNCQRAIQDYNRAIVILTTYGDLEHSTSQRGAARDGLIGSIRESISECR